jgi:eukaryotic-like serine/threonine-protein kinase
VSLTSGTRIGPYEISAQIGVGGMGEVYRATDTNLKRTVAIKVLPGAVAADEERLARFQREAEVLAALNHHGIAGIYGLEDTGAAKRSSWRWLKAPRSPPGSSAAQYP